MQMKMKKRQVYFLHTQGKDRDQRSVMGSDFLFTVPVQCMAEESFICFLLNGLLILLSYMVT